MKTKRMSKKMSKKMSKRMSKRKSMKPSKRLSKRKSFRPAKKPMSPECQQMFNVRKRFNIKAFKDGTVFKSGHKYETEQQAISSAFNQLRRLKPECFQ